MKLIQVQKPGPPGVMQLLDVPVPEPKPGEVLIQRARDRRRHARLSDPRRHL